jgi:hypothetical protein
LTYFDFLIWVENDFPKRRPKTSKRRLFHVFFTLRCIFFCSTISKKKTSKLTLRSKINHKIKLKLKLKKKSEKSLQLELNLKISKTKIKHNNYVNLLFINKLVILLHFFTTFRDNWLLNTLDFSTLVFFLHNTKIILTPKPGF